MSAGVPPTLNTAHFRQKLPYNIVKLLQGQIWNQGDEYLQVVHLERLEVQYKSFKNLATRAGTRHHVSKKEFCRLIKHAFLLTPEQIAAARIQSPTKEEGTGVAGIKTRKEDE